MEDNNKIETPLNIENLLPIAKDKQLNIMKDILEEDNVDKLKDLTHLFNAHQTKRQVVRLNALNDVQDALVEQMLIRLNNLPNNFANSDIANWLKVVQTAIDASQKNISQIDTTPVITYQQNNQININTVENLSKESRDRISNVLQQILQNNENIVNLNNEDIVYTDESVNLDTNENNINLEDNND